MIRKKEPTVGGVAIKLSQNLLEKRISATILRFAFPFFLSYFFQAVYSSADVYMVGHYASTAAVSAVAIGGKIVNNLTDIAVALGNGAVIILGQLYGSRRYQDFSRAFGTIATSVGLFALALTLTLCGGSSLFVRWLQAPAESAQMTRDYLIVCGIGSFFLIAYNCVAALLFAVGDSKTPLMVVFLSCLANILADIVLVRQMHLEAVGAALATAGSQCFSFLAVVVAVVLRRLPVNPRRGCFRIRRKYLVPYLRASVPIVAQTTLTGLTFLVNTSVIGTYSLTASAASGAVDRLTKFANIPAQAVSQALAPVVSQNMGAGNPDRARSALNVAIGLSLAVNLVIFAAFQLFPRFWFGVFIDDAAVVEAGVFYFRTALLETTCICFVFCFNMFYAGCGYSSFTMIVNLITSYAVRLPLILLFAQLNKENIGLLGLAPPAASVVGTIVCFIFLSTGKWRQNNVHISKA